MEEENVQVNSEFKKEFNYKKYLPLVAIVLVAIVLILVLASISGGGPKKTVKDFIDGFNKQKASKLIDNMDFIGMIAWSSWYDEDDFSENSYKYFMEDYKEYKESYGDELEEQLAEELDDIEKSFDDIKDEYKSYKMKIEKFEDVKELGENLYAVDAKISIKAKPKDKDEEEIDETETITFIVYKDKLIYISDLNI